MAKTREELDLPGGYALLLVELVARWRVTPEELLEGLDLTVEQLAEAGARVTSEQIATLIRRAIGLTGEPGLAYLMGLHMRVSSHGYLGFAAMTAATAREALELAVRFAPTKTDAIGLELHVEGASASLTFEERIPLGEAREFVIVALMVGIVQMARAMVGDEVTGHADLDFPEPPYFHRFAQLLPGWVRFGQPSNRLVFDASILDRPLKMADPIGMKLALEHCERELRSLGSGGRTIAKIREILPLAVGFRSLEEVAKRMHVSPRTLKRRLADQGTSFSSILDDMRRERAMLLLGDPSLSLDAIAERLGYSDAANFTRAFRRWTGKTPGMVRRS